MTNHIDVSNGNEKKHGIIFFFQNHNVLRKKTLLNEGSYDSMNPSVRHAMA